MKVSDVIKNCFVKLGYGVVDVTDAENLTAEQKDLSIFVVLGRKRTFRDNKRVFPVRYDGKRDARRRETSIFDVDKPENRVSDFIETRRGNKENQGVSDVYTKRFSGEATFEYCALCRRIRFRLNFRATFRAGFVGRRRCGIRIRKQPYRPRRASRKEVQRRYLRAESAQRRGKIRETEEVGVVRGKHSRE